MQCHKLDCLNPYHDPTFQNKSSTFVQDSKFKELRQFNAPGMHIVAGISLAQLTPNPIVLLHLVLPFYRKIDSPSHFLLYFSSLVALGSSGVSRLRSWSPPLQERIPALALPSSPAYLQLWTVPVLLVDPVPPQAQLTVKTTSAVCPSLAAAAGEARGAHAVGAQLGHVPRFLGVGC